MIEMVLGADCSFDQIVVGLNESQDDEMQDPCHDERTTSLNDQPMSPS